jgi:hypothetical protein
MRIEIASPPWIARGVALLGALLVLSALPPIAVARHLGEKIASERSRRGNNPITLAVGNAERPTKLHARVTSKPQGRVIGRYSVDCVEDSRSESRRGRFAGRTRLTKRLRLPFRGAGSCQVGAVVQLQGRGRVRLELFAKT